MAAGINWKRMGISLLLAALFGLFCAYGMSMIEIPGVVITMPILLTVFYSRLLIGFVIGLSGQVRILKGELANAVLRGAIIGAIVSVSVGFYGGGEVMVAFGIIYGMIIDLIATKLGTK